MDKFKVVGDQAVQYDPGHAALPWACVRFFLQLAVDNVTTFGVMVEGMEHIANIITRFAILEDLYLGVNLKVTDPLKNSLTRLYAKILGYLAKASNYYSSSTLKRVVQSVATDSTARQSISDLIAFEQGEVERHAALADAEKLELASSALGVLSQAQSQHDIHLKRILNDLENPINRISADLSQIVKLEKKAEQVQILKSLSTIPYPSHHQNAAKDRLAGSGTWLLVHPEFRSWRRSSSSTILWLHGIPGCGKTKLSSKVIDELKPTNSPAGSVEPFAFFYCARDPREPGRGQCAPIVRSLLRQIASQSPGLSLPKPVTRKYEQIQEDGFCDREWTKEECVETLVDIMDICPSMTIVIDALDECYEKEREDLLLTLKEIKDQSANLVKVFITSRDDIDVFATLVSASDIRIRTSDNAEDIEQFIHEKVDFLVDWRARRYGHVTAGLQDEIVTTLRSGAQGMYAKPLPKLPSCSHYLHVLGSVGWIFSWKP